MADNMRIWQAVEKTDPSHTKKVTFGRTFTSIDAHWQVMQATKQFGPVGQGWGYNVEHSIAALAPEMALAVADVTIWWRTEAGMAEIRHSYGPIRATCEMWSKNEKKGRMEVDEDAPKKAMTDALTKGLSHLGFSADVFLGLFDDNRYVQKVAREFANGNSTAPFAGNTLEQASREITEMTGETRSTYQIKTAEKPAGRLAAELWASNAVEMLKAPGFHLLQFKDWKLQPCTNKGTKTNGDKLDELREKHPDLADKIDAASDRLPVAAA